MWMWLSGLKYASAGTALCNVCAWVSPKYTRFADADTSLTVFETPPRHVNL